MDFSSSSNITTSATPVTGDLPISAGFIGATVAVLFFGSNFIPVKKYETGDGELVSQIFFKLDLLHPKSCKNSTW